MKNSKKTRKNSNVVTVNAIFKALGSKLGMGFLISWVGLSMGASNLPAKELELSFYQSDNSKETPNPEFVIDRSTSALTKISQSGLNVSTDCYVAYVPYNDASYKLAASEGGVVSNNPDIFNNDELLLDLDATTCRYVATTICDCSCLCQCNDCVCACPSSTCVCMTSVCHCSCNVCQCACACVCTCNCGCGCGCTCNCDMK